MLTRPTPGEPPRLVVRSCVNIRPNSDALMPESVKNRPRFHVGGAPRGGMREFRAAMICVARVCPSVFASAVDSRDKSGELMLITVVPLLLAVVVLPARL